MYYVCYVFYYFCDTKICQLCRGSGKLSINCLLIQSFIKISKYLRFLIKNKIK